MAIVPQALSAYYLMKKRSLDTSYPSFKILAYYSAISGLCTGLDGKLKITPRTGFGTISKAQSSKANKSWNEY